MKILLLSHSGVVTGGAEKCLLEYIDVLQKEGHKCKVIVPYNGEMTKALAKKKIQSVTVGYGWSTMPHRQVNKRKLATSTGNSLFRIFQEVGKYKPDVIITNTSVIPWGLYAGRAFGIPNILLVHEILNDKDPSLNMMPNYQDYAQILNNNADYVIYNSQFVKNEFAEVIKQPIISKKILYPLPKISEKAIETIYKENHFGSIIKIAIFGVLAPRKNQLEALKAAKVLIDNGITNFRIDLFGDKEADIRYTKSLRRYIKDNALHKYVKIKGYSTDVYETMNDYNVILSTSTYEPFGRTIIEGQLFGRTVIANDTGGGLELIDNLKTGLIYKLGDEKALAKSIEWISKNKEDAAELGVRAKHLQTARFLHTERYQALVESIDYFSKKPDMQKHDIDAFDPMRSLFEYTDQLNRRYHLIHLIFYNRITRSIKTIIVRTVSYIKKLIKSVVY